MTEKKDDNGKTYIDHLGRTITRQQTIAEQAEKHRLKAKAEYQRKKQLRIAAFEADLENKELEKPLPKAKKKFPTADIPTDVLIPVCTLEAAQRKMKESANQQTIFRKDDIGKIKEMASRGMLQQNIASYFKASPHQWLHYKIMYPEIAEAMREGYKLHEMKHLTNLDDISDKKEGGAVQAAIFKLKATHLYMDKPELLIPKSVEEEKKETDERVVDVISSAILGITKKAED